ncbi:NADH dehydrogenase 1 alpha subcomplex assembly factor 3 [Polychytrium aggregatum]|uniref:NADH dehydrogenase 1 alpha subcomplex assembly factor 3 n=1 Tax=Polychytrium aggregatum TaxID=110093 RepID=UPI0022FE5549|nr:NADH dehydrogenase 1 alpha subcomplex assembly factor 3 [Polychytrium aggregatum]KAI9199570.1 NADH dehydrogenase 1 alpha subcomplex assembly factor 3 [Polychytrium aggregatum]
MWARSAAAQTLRGISSAAATAARQGRHNGIPARLLSTSPSSRNNSGPSSASAPSAPSASSGSQSLSRHDILAAALPPGARVPKAVTNFGFTIGDISIQGPALIVSGGTVLMWDVPQFGVGSDVVVEGLDERVQSAVEEGLETDPGSVFYGWTAEVFKIFEVLHPTPEILVIGTGVRSHPLPENLRKYLHSLGIQIEILPTRHAASTYSLLLGDGRVVAAALLPMIPTSARSGRPVVDIQQEPAQKP